MKFLTAKEVAVAADIGIGRVYKYAKGGHLKHSKIREVSGRFHFYPEAIEQASAIASGRIYKGHADDAKRGLKRCPTCETRKPLDGFYNDKNRKDGHASICKPCSRAAMAKYRATPKGKKSTTKYNKSEEFRKRAREYQRSDKGKATAKRYRASPEGKAKRRGYYQSDAQKAKQKVYSKTQAFKDSVSKYRQTDKGRYADLKGKHARRASQNIKTAMSERAWQFTLDAFNHKCAYCRSDGPLHQDHVTPISKGGLHIVGNVIPACQSCNSSKSASEPRLWFGDRLPKIRRKLKTVKREWHKQNQVEIAQRTATMAYNRFKPPPPYLPMPHPVSSCNH